MNNKKCKYYREQFTLLLTDSLDHARRTEVESHLTGCESCRKEFETAKKVWNLMGKIPVPQPSESMRTGFNTMISDFKKEMVVKKNPIDEWINKLYENWLLHSLPKYVFSIFLVFIGFIAGYLLHENKKTAITYNSQIELLSSQLSEMKQLMVVSLLENPSASQRLQAVSYTDEMSNVDLRIVDALFTTLNKDSNVNVRLAALEALVKVSGEPRVREGLVRSISQQESPLMQSAIADVMAKLQEKSSVKPLQELLTKKDLNQMVKINIQKNISKLI
jgi:hypothetical protein